ncbi:unnamed protein product [Knipowitschia caucasica]
MNPSIILNGTFFKKSQQKKRISQENYKERFFVLNTNELTYFDCRSGKEVRKGSIELCKIKCVEIVETQQPIPCKYQFPFQVFYDQYYLYIFTPDQFSRQKWITALKEKTRHNDVVTTYHPDMWTKGKWRCCQKTQKLTAGCTEYHPVDLEPKKAVVPVQNPERLIPVDKRVVIAVQDYSPVESGDLAIHKDKKYILLDDSNSDRWLVQDSEENTGYVPSIYVAGKFETNFDRFDWYDNEMTREKATNLLLQQDREGAFMVRRSSKSGQFYLSVFSKSNPEEPTVAHYMINTKPNSEAPFYVKNKSFATIPELVHYHQHDCDGMVTRLRHPVSRPSPRRRTVDNGPHLEEQWQLDPLELTLDRKLGNGQFGLVMKGTWRDKKVAVKMINKGAMSEEEFKDEAKTMMKLSHCKLVQLYGVCTQRSPLCIVFEFMEQGALLDFLKARKGSHSLSQERLFGMCLDVCEGMCFLERSNFIHRDLAARNCLVSHDNVVKVADFGMARFVLDNEYTTSQGSKFPVRWSAPEVILFGRHSSKADVWSFGILMWEVYSEGILPYEKNNTFDVVKLVKRGERLSKPELAPDDVHALMEWCWKEKPEDRPTFALLLHQLEYLFVELKLH